MHVVGSDQLYAEFLGQAHQIVTYAALFFKSVVLKFDIEVALVKHTL